MATDKKVKLEAKKPDQAAASSTVQPLANRFQRLSAAVTRHAFAFLTANELAQGAFQVCKAFRSAREDAKLYSIVEVTRRDTPEATVIELIQRANGHLQQLSLDGVGSITSATLTALAANASPARFRALSIKRCGRIADQFSNNTISEALSGFLREWTAARHGTIERGQQMVPLAISCAFDEAPVLGAGERRCAQRDSITLDGWADDGHGGVAFLCESCDKPTRPDCLIRCDGCWSCSCNDCVLSCSFCYRMLCDCTKIFTCKCFMCLSHHGKIVCKRCWKRNQHAPILVRSKTAQRRKKAQNAAA